MACGSWPSEPAMRDAALPLLGRRVNPLLARQHGVGDRRRNPRAMCAVVLSGNCLRPWLLHGDGAWFDKSLEPRNGDVVLVAMKYVEKLAGGFSVLGGTPSVTTRTAVKQLSIEADGKWLVCADGKVSAEAHAIRGVLVGTCRPPLFSLRRWRHPMQTLRFPAGARF